MLFANTIVIDKEVAEEAAVDRVIFRNISFEYIKTNCFLAVRQ